MQRILLVLLWVMGLGVAQGQHSEFSVQAGSGLFSFRGSGALSQTGRAIMAPGLYHPHGKASGFSYGLTGQWQHVGRKGLLAGFQLGYESLTSRLIVNELVGDFYTSNNMVDGQGWLKNQYVLLNPFVGKRFGTAKASLDVTAGVDLALGLSSRDSYSIRVDGATTPGLTGTDHDMPTVDVRPRVNLTGYYRSFGLNVGYSYGLINYTPNSRYDNTSVYSQYWRAGLSYRFGRRG